MVSFQSRSFQFQNPQKFIDYCYLYQDHIVTIQFGRVCSFNVLNVDNLFGMKIV
jgi:hypothetical protein